MNILPQQLHIGMAVYDRNHRHIGKVDDFKFSENQMQPDAEPADIDATDHDDNNSLMADLAKAFSGDDMPEEQREQLLREGYIRIDADGLFAGDRYILPRQIASAAGDEIMLNVNKDDLIKSH